MKYVRRCTERKVVVKELELETSVPCNCLHRGKFGGELSRDPGFLHVSRSVNWVTV